MTTRKNTPEKRWSASAKKLWVETLDVYDLPDEHHRRMLSAACEQLTRADQCREEIARQGLSFTDRFGQPRPNPLIAEERSCLGVFRLLVRELGLDVESPNAVNERHRLPRAVGYA